MRKVILIVATVAVAVLALGSVAQAALTTGGPGDDEIVGTDHSDTILGRRSADRLFGLGSTDVINGGKGNDLVVGGGEDELSGAAGDDTIYTGTRTESDKWSDEIPCGSGTDTVYLSGQDHAAHNITTGACENLRNY
ncbi:MAG TPA: hypothetical protein VHH10_02985 [Rubrobacteraceae bacterium]|nr:hypothetical protein [Rubrobacteraceae bacterium]